MAWIYTAYASVVGWFTGNMFTGNMFTAHVATVISVLTFLVKRAAPLIAHAEPIVEAINEELKPRVQDPEDSTLQAIVDFLAGYLPHPQDGSVIADNIYENDPESIYLEVAMVILAAVTKDNQTARSVMKWVIESAYQVYKKKQADKQKKLEKA